MLKKKGDLDAARAYAADIVKLVRGGMEDKYDVGLLDEEILSEVTDWIPTGFAELDDKLGGGWALGRVSEVYGREGVGKSALGHMAVKSTLDVGGLVYYIDTENALDPDKMRRFGIDPARVVYVTPKHVEEAWDGVFKFMENKLIKNPPGVPVLIVWDSIAASIPKWEWDNDFSKKATGGVSQAMSRGCRKAYRLTARTGCHFMFVNQLRAKFGSGGWSGGPSEATVGGVAVDYAATVRVRLSRYKTLKQTVEGNTQKTGYVIKSYVAKNKVYPPHQESFWILDFTHGPSPELTMFYLLKQKKAIKSASGGWYQITGDKDAGNKFTRYGFVERMQEDEEFRCEIEDIFHELIRTEAFTFGDARTVGTDSGDEDYDD